MVVFPAPFGPSRPITCPAGTLSVTSSTAQFGIGVGLMIRGLDAYLATLEQDAAAAR